MRASSCDLLLPKCLFMAFSEFVWAVCASDSTFPNTSYCNLTPSLFVIYHTDTENRLFPSFFATDKTEHKIQIIDVAKNVLFQNVITNPDLASHKSSTNIYISGTTDVIEDERFETWLSRSYTVGNKQSYAFIKIHICLERSGKVSNLLI